MASSKMGDDKWSDGVESGTVPSKMGQQYSGCSQRKEMSSVHTNNYIGKYREIPHHCRIIGKYRTIEECFAPMSCYSYNRRR
jgi:hypothetical protein